MADLHGDPGLASDREATATPIRHLRGTSGAKPKRKVLIAEDSPVVRVFLRHSLEHADLGLDVYEAEDGLDAVASLERENFDLLICDLNMPHVNGREVCSLIEAKRAQRPFPILIFSSDFRGAELARAKGDPQVRFLQKPASVADIVGSIQALLPSPR